MNKLKRLIMSTILFCSVGIASAATAPTVYDEGPGVGWTQSVWSGTINPAMTGNIPFKGWKYIKTNFTVPWGGITFTPQGGFDTRGYTNLSLAVRNWKGGQGLFLYTIDKNGQKSPNIYLNNHVDVWLFPPGQWKWVRVPIALLNLTDPNIVSIKIETDVPAEIHYDEVRFDSSVTLYEGVLWGTQFQRGPTNMFWHWNSDVNQQYREPTLPGNNILSANFLEPWGGLQFEIHHHSVFPSTEYRYLTSMVKTFDAEQEVYAYFMNADTGEAVLPAVRVADYLPRRVHTPNAWQRVVIPMTAFLKGTGSASVRIGSFMFEGKMPGTVLMDNIAVINPFILKWPIATRVLMERFGANDATGAQCPAGVPKKNNGVDFVSEAGADVFASEKGQVKEVKGVSGWGWNVVLEHTHPSKGKFTTTSGNINPWVAPGTWVARGQQIGVVTDLSPYGRTSRFHFGIHIGAYNGAFFRGNFFAGTSALPFADCGGSPHFPADFLNPVDPKNAIFW